MSATDQTQALASKISSDRKPYSLARVLDAVPYLKLSTYHPSEETRKYFMFSLIGALQGDKFVSKERIEIIAILILLAPPTENKYDNMSALQPVSQKVNGREIDLSKYADKEYESCLHKVRDPEACSVKVGKVSVGVDVDDGEFAKWCKSAPIGDSMAYFRAISTILLRAHITTSASDIKDAIYSLIHLWPTFSRRTRPLAAFPIKDSALKELCKLIRCDKSMFHSILKMLVAHHHWQTKDRRQPSKFVAAYFDFMVKSPFAYHGIESFKLADQVLDEYDLLADHDSCEDWFERRFNNDSLLFLAKKYLEIKRFQVNIENAVNYASFYKAFEPYHVVFNPQLFESFSPDKSEELLAASVGLLGRSGEHYKGDEYLYDIWVDGAWTRRDPDEKRY